MLFRNAGQSDTTIAGTDFVCPAPLLRLKVNLCEMSHRNWS